MSGTPEMNPESYGEMVKYADKFGFDTTKLEFTNNVKLSDMKMQVIKGDITSLSVDAIVNAANNSLLGGGGVDGAIHSVAGPQLLEECNALNGCNTGEAKLTNAYMLPSRYVIHTVGPVWHGGDINEEKLLASAYRSSLEIAEKEKFKTIAFPNISTGVYGFPRQKAADIAIETVNRFLKDHLYPEKVIFVCFDTENFSIYNTHPLMHKKD